MDISVISGDLDGRELRQEKRKRRNYVCCDGKDDHEQIQEAIDHVSSERRIWGGLGEAWNRIFGRK